MKDIIFLMWPGRNSLACKGKKKVKRDVFRVAEKNLKKVVALKNPNGDESL